MAPLKASGSPSTPIPAPQLRSKTTTTTTSASQTAEVPLASGDDQSPAMSPLTRPVVLEPEGDLESETDLPTMTPPSKPQLPLRAKTVSTPNEVANLAQSVSSSPLIMPHMQRAHSSPGPETTGRIFTPAYSYPRRPASPMSAGRRRSPLRSAFEEAYPGSSWGALSIEPNIPEHAELEISTPVTPENEISALSIMPVYSTISNTFPRSRRRPTSPLHQSASAPSLQASVRAANVISANGNPGSFSALSTAKYANEPYPVYGSGLSSASSMPSTPTSLRSRSPSISSLETIEDTPDAEEEARLQDEHTKQRTSDEFDAGFESRRKSLELRAANLRSNKDRKRWSVCGAERRADFSLEPIEE